jgi:hypothetical protein
MAQKVEHLRHDREAPRDIIQRWTNMLVISFRVSEGSPDQQSRALRYVKGLHPDSKIDRDALFTIEAGARTLIYPLFFPTESPPADIPKYAVAERTPLHTDRKDDGIMLTKKSINLEIWSTLEDMHKIFNDEPEDPKALIPEISNELLRKDFKYLVYPGGGRPKAPAADEDRSFLHDPWGSFLVEFVMRGRNTGVPEFNEMFADVKSYIDKQRSEQTELWTDEMEPKFAQIIESHNEHHPDNQFTEFNQTEAVTSST